MINSKQLNTICAVLFGFFVMGFCDIVGISSDYAKDAFGWSNTMAGFVPSMVFVWFLFLGVPTGILMNRWGRKNTVLISMAVTVIGMMIPLLKTSSACVIGYALLGIGNAILQVSLNPLLAGVVTDQKLLTSSLTAGQVVKAVSSFVGPFIMLFAVNILGGGNKDNWYLAFPVLGLVTLVSGLWLMFSPVKDERKQPSVEGTQSSANAEATFALLKNPTILMLFFGIFFVVGIDVATNFVSSKVLIQRFGWETTAAGVAPQTYFFCRTIGAFLGVFLMTKIKEMTYFRWNIVICIVMILILAFSPVQSAWLDLVCVGAIGFLCSCIFPIIYSMALQAEPDKGNLISGLMITAVAGGGAVTPLIGWANDTFQDITAGVCILLICAIYLTFCSFKKMHSA